MTTVDCVAEHGPIEAIEVVPCEVCNKVCGLPHSAVNLVARIVQAKYADWTTVEDVQQEIWVSFFSDEKAMRKVAEEKPNLFKAMAFSRARDYCRKQKAWYCGYEPSDAYYYSRGTLRALLPSVFGGDVADEGGGSVDGPKGHSGGNLDTMIIDVKCALEALPEADRQVLFEVYGQWAESPTRSPVYDKAQRLLRKMQEALGGPPSQ